MLVILEKINPSELISNGYISNHNKVWRPCPKFKVSLYLYFCCFWINVTQINIENIKRKIQRIISDSCFQLKSWFNVDARASSIPLLNFPFKLCIHACTKRDPEMSRNHNLTSESITETPWKFIIRQMICNSLYVAGILHPANFSIVDHNSVKGNLEDVDQ